MSKERAFIMSLNQNCGFVEDKEVRTIAVLAEKQQTLVNGQMGIFRLNGKYIFKRYFQENNIIKLEEPNMEPIIVKKGDNFKIVGKAKSYYVGL